MNRIDLTNIGGFPLEQDTLKFMQDGYGDLFESVARLCGDKTILSGVVVTGSNVSSGWISYNGELIKFVGGTVGAGVIIQETAQGALFEDGTTKPVYKTRTATIGSPATFNFSDLVRIDTLAGLWAKVNKPAGLVSYMGSANIGDVVGSGASVVSVTIPDQNTATYIVTGSLVSQGTPAQDSNVMWIIANKTATGFQIVLRESNNATQNLRFEFAIIKTA